VVWRGKGGVRWLYSITKERKVTRTTREEKLIFHGNMGGTEEERALLQVHWFKMGKSPSGFADLNMKDTPS